MSIKLPTKQVDWVNSGKTIRQLIAELETFDNKDLIVKISTDGGSTRCPISLVGRSADACLLTYNRVQDKPK